MTLMLQPPDKSKETPPEKPGGEPKQNPAKTEEKNTPTKDAPAKTAQDAPAKDAAIPLDQQQPIIPNPDPPGAKLAVPAKEQPKNFKIGTILEPALWLIAILATGAILLAWLKKSRERQLGAATLTANDQLSAFRDSMEEGDMTEEEFKKVKALLAEKIRNPANPVTTTPGQSTTASPSPAPNQPPC